MSPHPIVDDLYTRALEARDVDRSSVGACELRGREASALVLRTTAKRWRSPRWPVEGGDLGAWLPRDGAEGLLRVEAVALDADDTLWHNESIFHLTQQNYVDLLKDYGDPDHMKARLFEVELKNLSLYGYGVKSFTLSMIESAIDLTRGAVPAKIIAEIMDLGRAMLDDPHWAWHAARDLGAEVERPAQYKRVGPALWTGAKRA